MSRFVKCTYPSNFEGFSFCDTRGKVSTPKTANLSNVLTELHCVSLVQSRSTFPNIKLSLV